MKLGTNTYVSVCACLLSIVAIATSVRAMQTKTSPGMLPYSPTRLEWLELDLQACFRTEDNINPEASYAVNYYAKEPDTIVVLVQYSDHTSAKIVETAVEHAKRVAEKEVAGFGWSSWAKVEVQRVETDVPSKK
jgi:hypothetical protein